MEWIKGISFLFLFSLSSCINNKIINSTEFNEIIDNYYNNNCESSCCVISFNSLFDFEWDKMYLFNEDYYPEIGPKEISKKIGIEYEGERKFKDQLIVFVLDDEIIETIRFIYDGFGNDVEFVINEKFPEYISFNSSDFELGKREDDTYYLRYLGTPNPPLPNACITW